MGPLPFARAELAAVLAPLEVARSLPPAAYLDETVLAYEQRAILDASWRCVGREEDVARPGEWLCAPITPEGVVVVRGVDLALRAFYNVCRHRAALLVEAERGSARATELRCPYHGWTYGLDGALRDAPHALPTLDRASHRLSEVRVGVWQGFVFVACDPSVPELAAYLEPPPPWLVATSLAHARRARAVTYEVAANWKLLAENFQESHHFARIHPALERLTPNGAARSVLSSGPWLGGTMEFADGVETVSPSGLRDGRPFLAAPAHRRVVSDALLFPTLLTSLQPDYFLAYRLHPLSASRTRVAAETFVHPALADHSSLAELFAFWDTVNAEDRAVCESQQIGVGSRGYRASGYTSVEDGVHAFDVRVARAYLALYGDGGDGGGSDQASTSS